MRHYPATGHRLGLVNGGTVFGQGPFTQGDLASLGSAEAYLCKAARGPPPAGVKPSGTATLA